MSVFGGVIRYHSITAICENFIAVGNVGLRIGGGTKACSRSGNQHELLGLADLR